MREKGGKREGRPMPSNLSFGRQMASQVLLSSDTALLIHFAYHKSIHDYIVLITK
jgi:hypothetical protein